MPSLVGSEMCIRDRYYFLDKLMNIALPRVRDFRGVNPTAFDGRGNYALGMKEQLIFPEIEYDKIDKVRGMDIIIVTTAKTDEEARELLRLLGMPFLSLIHISEPTRLGMISYAVFCLKKKKVVVVCP